MSRLSLSAASLILLDTVLASIPGDETSIQVQSKVSLWKRVPVAIVWRVASRGWRAEIDYSGRLLYCPGEPCSSVYAYCCLDWSQFSSIMWTTCSVEISVEASSQIFRHLWCIHTSNPYLPLRFWNREKQKVRIKIYLWMIHVGDWRKTTKFCKAFILHTIKKYKLRITN